MKFVWDEQAWAEYSRWQQEDKRILARINELLKDIARNRNDRMGKPEPLKHGFQGHW